MFHKKNDANLIVIGAGSGGLISSYIAAALKAKVILIEQHKMGGDCLNTGCVPSKALIAAAKAAYVHKKSLYYGVQYPVPQILQPKVLAHVRETVKTIEPNDSAERYRQLGVNVVIGQAELIDSHTVKVADKLYRAKKIIIASGASPAVPSINGIDTIPYLTSQNLWNLSTLPRSMAILGGGPIGCELAQAFCRLGVVVTLLEADLRLLPREDKEVQDIVEQALNHDGVRVFTQTAVTKVEKVCQVENSEENNEQVKIYSAAGEFIADKILIATGRKANTKGFGLEKLPLKYNPNGTIAVNEYMETDVKGIYAVGDVTGPYQFTHASEHQAWHATVNALFGKFKKFKISYNVLPAITFVAPEVARVGLNETEAKRNKVPYDVSIFHFAELDRAIADKNTEGFIQVLTPKAKDKILGATIVGANAGEMLAEFTLAMKHNIGLNKILGTIHPYPSYSGGAKKLAGQWKKAHTPRWAFPILQNFHKIFR